MHPRTDRRRAVVLRAAALPLVLMLAGSALAQTPPPAGQLQVGLGVVPGLGAQVVYFTPGSFYTLSGGLYMDVSPGFAGGEGSVQASLGLGGALRPLGLLRLLGNTGYTGYDVDLGLRFGPSLFFPFAETRATKNQRFSLFLEPFVRFTSGFGTKRTFFAEVGIQRPVFRAGLWFDI